MEWEYLTLDKKFENKELITEDLNILGSQGWELISVVQTPPEKWGGEWTVSGTFKRPKKKQIL